MKKNKIGICVIILLLILSPWITHYLVTTPSFFGFITPENQDTWIGFFGAIIGGGATLIGVWWTLFQQKKDKYDNTEPFLLMTIQTVQSKDEFNRDELTLIKKFKNVGKCNAEMLNISISLPNLSHKICFDGAKLLPPKFESFAYVGILSEELHNSPLYYDCILTWESKYKSTKYEATYKIQIRYDYALNSYIASINLFDIKKSKLKNRLNMKEKFNLINHKKAND